MKFAAVATSLFASILPVLACDFCPCEAEPLRIDGRLGWHAGIHEQYTDIGRLQDSGRGIANPAGQYLHSSITQIIAGYDFAATADTPTILPMI